MSELDCVLSILRECHWLPPPDLPAYLERLGSDGSERKALLTDVVDICREILLSPGLAPASTGETPAQAANRLLAVGLAARGWSRTFLDRPVSDDCDALSTAPYV